MEFNINNIDEMNSLAEKIARHLKEGDNILLWGDLGAGKTHFVKAMGKALEIDEYITSPTFNLHNFYNGKIDVNHFDLYRLEEPEEAIELALDNYFYDASITIVEWPERAEEFLPDESIDIYIEKTGETERKVEIKGHGQIYERLIKELKE